MRAAPVAVAGCFLLFSCGRGPAGRKGQPGGPGGFADAPKIISISPSTVSYGVLATITGENFATVTTNDQVWIGGWKGEVLAATSTELTVDHLVPPDLAAADQADLTVVTHDQTSNPIRVGRAPRGSVVQVPVAALREGAVEGMAQRDDGSIEVVQGSEVLEISADGDVSFLFHEVSPAPGAHATVGRGDGIYYLTSGEVRRFYDGGDHRVWQLPAGTPRALAFDAVANLYVLVQGAASATIYKRDYITFATSTFATVASTDAESMFFQGASLFVGDVAGSRIFEYPLATPNTPDIYTTGIVARSITGDGTNLYVYDAGRVKKMTAAGAAPADWSSLTIGPTADEISRDVNGAIVLRKDAVIWRMPDTTTLLTHAAPLADGRGVGTSGGTIYAGSDVSCQVGDSHGGVLYEARLDGTLRHVSGGFCAHNVLTFSFLDAKFLAADVRLGSVEEIDNATGLNTTLIGAGTLTDPRFVLSQPGTGNMYVANRRGDGVYRISSYTPGGILVTADFIVGDTEAPSSGAIVGSNLMIGYPSSHRILSAPVATGGAPAPVTGNGFAPDPEGMAATTYGTLLVTDASDHSLWQIDSSGVPVRLAGTTNPSSFWEIGDGRLASVGKASIDLVMP
jgi:DNA-binding beta-propeller fold protein YncE